MVVRWFFGPDEVRGWGRGREYDIKYQAKELIITLNNGLSFGTFFWANLETKSFLF